MEHTLREDAERLLAHMQLTPPREAGEKLRAADELRILELSAAGHTQVDIARAVGCHQSTVSRTMADYDDSRPLARKYLEAQALDMTKRMVVGAKPETILRVLAKLDVVRDEDLRASGSGVTVCIGIAGAPLRVPNIAPLESQPGLIKEGPVSAAEEPTGE